MKRRRKTARWIVVLAVVMTILPTHAHSAGSATTRQAGKSLISIVKTTVSKITRLADLAIDDVDKRSSAARTSEIKTTANTVCVHSSSGSYNLSAESVNQQFNLIDNDSGKTIPYKLYWTTQHGQNELLPDKILSGLRTNQQGDCSGDSLATLKMSISNRNYHVAPNGAYIDTVTLLMQPE